MKTLIISTLLGLGFSLVGCSQGPKTMNCQTRYRVVTSDTYDECTHECAVAAIKSARSTYALARIDEIKYNFEFCLVMSSCPGVYTEKYAVCE